MKDWKKLQAWHLPPFVRIPIDFEAICKNYETVIKTIDKQLQNNLQGQCNDQTWICCKNCRSKGVLSPRLVLLLGRSSSTITLHKNLLFHVPFLLVNVFLSCSPYLLINILEEFKSLECLNAEEYRTKKTETVSFQRNIYKPFQQKLKQ